MGICFSSAPKQLIGTTDGDEDAYHKRYMEGDILGEGEFGQVRIVHDMTQGRDQNTPYASKCLKKGIVFKDNTLYSPIKPEILRGEVDMLRKLGGKCYCLKLLHIFETPKVIYMVTEFCGGGEMMEYVGNRDEDLRTEDVSRIAFQLLSAVDHCSKCRIIHRDIKPENIMFQDPTPQAELRLIDFGSGTIDPHPSGGDDPKMHTTFAGSAFYISPEMFQRTYTDKTDVWSVGATLYVLVAGYPAEKLQKAFNILQTGQNRNLKTLPNLPEEMPDSFYEMLEGLLTYRHKKRPSAGEMIKCDFVQFHLEHEETNSLSLDEVAAAAAEAVSSRFPTGKSPGRTMSISLKGSVDRHNIFLGFKKYERSLTALLATMLAKKELEDLVEILRQRVRPAQSIADAAALVAAQVTSEEEGKTSVHEIVQDKEQQLSVIKVLDLKGILEKELQNKEIVSMMEKLPGATVYETFAYHVSLLKDFSNESGSDGSNKSFSGRRRLSRQGSFTAGGRFGNSSVSSSRSVRSLKGSNKKRASKIAEKKPNSVSDGRMFGPRPKAPQLQRDMSVAF